jgi:hypothetical protein
MTIRAATALGLAVLVAGCAYQPRQVADPGEITLDSALMQLANGLNNMRDQTRARDKLGLIVDEAEVTLNISAKATKEGQLTLSASQIPIASGLLGLTASEKLSNEGTRGNTIVIRFKNIATADLSKGDRRLLDDCFGNKPPKICSVMLLTRPQPHER